LGVALYPSAQSGNNPRKNGQAAPVGVLPTRRRRFAVTPSQRHGLATSRPRNAVSNSASKEPKIGIILGTTHPTRFSEKGGAMAGEHRQAPRRRRIRGRRSSRLSDAALRVREIADVSAAEERNRVALGQEDGGARWLHFRDSRVQSRPAFVLKNAHSTMPMPNTIASRLHSSAMEAREPHERWSSCAWFLRNCKWPR
jgi:hypothetical protein